MAAPPPTELARGDGMAAALRNRSVEIRFDASSHTYWLPNGAQCDAVSSVVQSLFPQFDKHAVVARMLRGKERIEDERSRYSGMRAAEILEQWDLVGKEAREAGAVLHTAIEAFYLTGIFNVDGTAEFERKFKLWDAEVRQARGWVPVAVEIRVASYRLQMAGTFDALFRAGNSHMVLVDWKRIKELKHSNRWECGNADGPAARVHNCNFEHYSLQLRFYAHLLWESFKIYVAEAWIVRFHPNCATYEMCRVMLHASALAPVLEWRLGALRKLRGV